MTANITTKICQFVCVENSLSIENQSARLDGISISNGLVTTKLVPSDYEIDGIITTKLIKEIDIDGETGEYCYKSAQAHVEWYRGRFDSFPIIVHTLIDSCRISGYLITSFGTNLSIFGHQIPRWILFAFFSLKLGDINDEDGILQYDPENEIEHQQTQNQITPGEDVQLFAWLKPPNPPGELIEQWIGHVWWGTDYFSGGKIISVNGEYGDTNITYTVSIMGEDRIVLPSDFIEYEVNDWVYVTHLGTIGQGCEWESDEDIEIGISEDVGDVTWIILPIKISDYGA